MEINNIKLLYTLIILFAFLFAENISPCENEIYLQLKEIKLDEMTETHFREFLILSNDCSIYENYQLLNDSLNQRIMAIQPHKPVVNNYNTYKYGTASIIWFLIIHNNFLK